MTDCGNILLEVREGNTEGGQYRGSGSYKKVKISCLKFEHISLKGLKERGE